MDAHDTYYKIMNYRQRAEVILMQYRSKNLEQGCSMHDSTVLPLVGCGGPL